MSILLGTNGTIKEIKEIYTDVNGEVHKIIEGYVGVGGVPKCFYKGGPVPGNTWLITESGRWTVPATGYYRIELHGGGGGGAGVYMTRQSSPVVTVGGGSGGGSGELFQNQLLTARDVKSVVVGKGGAGGPGNSGDSSDFENYGENGGDTTFGELTTYGGTSGIAQDNGYGYGSLATDGEFGNYNEQAIGGSGGATVGNYGSGGNGGYGDQLNGSNGEDGAVIITYIGDQPKKDPELQFSSDYVNVYTSTYTGSTTVSWLGGGELHVSFKQQTYDFTVRIEGNTIYVTASRYAGNASATLVVSVDETDEYLSAEAEIPVRIRMDA